jgi:hypothetical protein
MKLIWILSVFTIIFPIAFAQATEHHELSTIQSIDDFDLDPAYSEPSEEALPHEDLLKLLNGSRTDGFTVLAESRVRELFSTLERNPRARMRVAGGKCSYRRSYIQGYLRNLGIVSGRLYIQCPSYSGRLRLIDQVTGRRYTFTNFHDTNVVAVRTSSGRGYNVMDVQFKSGPVTLGQYLAEIEAAQKLKPLKNRSSGDRGYCYWSIR